MPNFPSGPDPNFPDRPDHPHFRLLADLAQRMDGDLGEPVFSVASFCTDEKVDEPSLEYMIQSKAEFIRRLVGGSTAAHQATLANGFLLGYLFAVNRTDLP